jgi:predicted HTH transcriptional regulator
MISVHILKGDISGMFTIAERTIRKWFARFKAGDLNLEDRETPTRSFTPDEDQIKTLMKNNPRYTTRELAEVFKISKSTIHETFMK